MGVANETTLELSWNPAEGRADSYTIRYDPNWGLPPNPAMTSDESYTIRGLDPGVDYTVTITTVAGSEQSAGSQAVLRTGKAGCPLKM